MNPENALGSVHTHPNPDQERFGRLFVDAYPQLHAAATRLLRRERWNHTLQPTAVVHEIFLRLADQRDTTLQNVEHLVGLGVEIARRVLVDHARGRLSAKRGAGWQRIGIDEAADRADRRQWTDVLTLDDAMDRLHRVDPRMGRIAALHVYGGLGHEQIARLLGVGRTTVATEWLTARAWLTRELRGAVDAAARR